MPSAAPANSAGLIDAIAARLVDLLDDPSDSQSRAALYRLVHSQLATSYFGLAYADPAFPDFWPIFNQAFNCLAPNPDDVYLIAPIVEDGVYRLSGYRGTVRVLDFQIGNSPLVSRGEEPFGPTLANYDLDTATLGADGGFEVVLSAERPLDCAGNWWQLPPGSNYLLARQRSYDWHKELDGRIAIERLDGPSERRGGGYPTDPEKIAQWAESWARFSINFARSYIERDLLNRVVVTDLTKKGGFSRQQYVEGLFEIGDDEALIYETDVPPCRYWNLQLTDMMWVTLDYLNRQTSLNGHTATLDADGKFRAVISASDPGVPNWLDSMGLRRGVIFGRWLETERLPVATVTKVSLLDLCRHLPAATPRISPQQRERAIRERRKGAQLRRRW